jgi:hypothetical protein
MISIEEINQLEGIEEALTQIYEDEILCSITNLEMQCDSLVVKSYNGYELSYQDEINIDDIDSSVIRFGKSNILIVYVDDEDYSYSISGDYSLLEGFDFSQVASGDRDGLSDVEYYSEVNDFVLTGIYYSRLSEEMGVIYLAQFLQTLIYLVVVATIFLLMNFKANVKKLSYYNATKIVIVAMTGPAFLTAIIALINPGLASISFFILFALRAMLLYYKMNFSDETYID